jgi:hypothetical protein
MATKPRIIQKNCDKCDEYQGAAAYYKTPSPFFPDGHLSICKTCLTKLVTDWQSMDDFCQWANYPFLPEIWARLSKELAAKALDAYVKGYCDDEPQYGKADWKLANAEWTKLLKNGGYRRKIEALSANEIDGLRDKWGDNYKVEDLMYMDQFYKGLCTSHNIITELQRDAARTIAKISVRISQKITEGADIDKDITAYDKLMKSAGFTTENIKNMNDFESIGELVGYLEKTGWINPYYDDAPKDVVDTTIANIQNYMRKLVLGESNLKEQVEKKISALGLSASGEFELTDEQFDNYSDEGYVEVEAKIDNEVDTDEPELEEMVFE